MNNSGFFKRFAAFIVDYTLIVILVYISGFLYGLLLANFMPSALSAAAPVVISALMGLLIFVIYFIAWEASKLQATPGKLLLQIKVTDTTGARLPFLKTVLRNFSKILSAAPFMLGFIAAAFTKNKQALHDIIAKALVVNTYN